MRIGDEYQRTYRIVLSHVKALIEQCLLGVHLLEIAQRITMHLDAIWCWRDPRMRAKDLFLGLGEGCVPVLGILRHVEFEEVATGLIHGVARHGAVLRLLHVWGVMARILGYLRRKVLQIQGIGQVCELLVCAMVFVVGVV